MSGLLLNAGDFMDYNININGIDVHASYSENSIETIFRPLLLKLVRGKMGTYLYAMVNKMGESL